MTPRVLGYQFWPNVGDLEGRAIIESGVVLLLAGPLAEARQRGYTLTLRELRFYAVSPDGDGAAAACEHATRVSVLHVDAGVLEHVERRTVNVLAAVVGEDSRPDQIGRSFI